MTAKELHDIAKKVNADRYEKEQKEFDRKALALSEEALADAKAGKYCHIFTCSSWDYNEIAKRLLSMGFEIGFNNGHYVMSWNKITE